MERSWSRRKDPWNIEKFWSIWLDINIFLLEKGDKALCNSPSRKVLASTVESLVLRLEHIYLPIYLPFRWVFYLLSSANSDITVKRGTKRKNRPELWLNSQGEAQLPTPWGRSMCGHRHTLVPRYSSAGRPATMIDQVSFTTTPKTNYGKSSCGFPWLHFAYV